jgi:ubiquinone/menaquinone biosynthesis C-methylase UbiE
VSTPDPARRSDEALDSVLRFDGNAARYASSELHRSSPSLSRLNELVSLPARASLCDVACGTGNLALSFADRVARIVGVDPAPKMLAQFAAASRERGLDIETVQSRAESIPLEDETFDLVASRLAPHHFADVRAAVGEMARIAKRNGRVAVIDLAGHDDPAIDAFNHTLEVLHDPTHGRSLRAGEWRALFEDAGLAVEALEATCERPQGIAVKRWCETTACGPDNEAAIRAELSAATPAMRRALDIREEGGEFFITSRTTLIVGRKR